MKTVSSGVALFCAVTLSLMSCVMDSEVVAIWGGDVTVPKLIDSCVTGPKVARLRFDREVSVTGAEILLDATPPRSIPACGEPVASVPGAAAYAVDVVFEETVGVGVGAAVSATVEDGKGNTLSFVLPFVGFNNRVPRLRISEVRFAYSKPKVEFIELLALSAGNLAGVEICNPLNEALPSYQMPAAEVQAGDYVVWHLRTVEEGVLDELGPRSPSGLGVSAGVDASAQSRDLWSALTKAPLKTNNVIVVRERKGGLILDALLCSDGLSADWASEAVRGVASEAVATGAWLGGEGIGAAASAAGSTVTRTLGRRVALDGSALLDSDSASDWCVCPTGKATPGARNWSPSDDGKASKASKASKARNAPKGVTTAGGRRKSARSGAGARPKSLP
jgi:hypothetical protein